MAVASVASVNSPPALVPGHTTAPAGAVPVPSAVSAVHHGVAAVVLAGCVARERPLLAHAALQAPLRAAVASVCDAHRPAWGPYAAGPSRFVEAKWVRPHVLPLTHVRYSRSGHVIATASYDRMAKLWDPATMKDVAVLEGHKNVVYTLSFNADDSLLLSGSFDKCIRVWRVPRYDTWYAGSDDSSDTVHCLQGHLTEVVCLDGHPKYPGLALSGGMDNSTRVWDLETGKEVVNTGNHPGTHTAEVVTVDWCESQRCLYASGSFDHTARLWDTRLQGSVMVLQARGEISDVRINPAGTLLATGSIDRTFRVRSMLAGGAREIVEHVRFDDEVLCVSWASDGARCAAGAADGTWAQVDGRSLEVLRAPRRSDGEIASAAYTPDGRTLVTGGSDNRVRTWDMADGGALVDEFTSATDEVFQIDVARSGTAFVAGSKDNNARVFELAPNKAER